MKNFFSQTVRGRCECERERERGKQVEEALLFSACLFFLKEARGPYSLSFAPFFTLRSVKLKLQRAKRKAQMEEGELLAKKRMK